MSKQNEISDKEFAIKQGLRNIYYDPKTGYRLPKSCIKKQKRTG